MLDGRAGFVFLCAVFSVRYALESSSIAQEVQQPKTCSQWRESAVLSDRCARSLVYSSSIKENEQRLSYLTPKEMIRLHDVGTSDWYSLVLFPSIEYEVVRKCVLEGEVHPYCDGTKREEFHRLVDQNLLLMMTSRNEDRQHRGMILACNRSKKGRILDVPEESSIKLRNMILYTQLCTESRDEMKERVQMALKDSSLRSMALLSMMSKHDIEAAVTVDDSWTLLEKSFLQGLHE